MAFIQVEVVVEVVVLEVVAAVLVLLHLICIPVVAGGMKGATDILGRSVSKYLVLQKFVFELVCVREI